MNKNDQSLLIDTIYNQNEFVKYSLSESIPITKYQEKILKSQIKSYLNDPKIIKNYKIKKDKVVNYFHYYKTDYLHTNIIQCELVLPPPISIIELEDIIRSIDRRIKKIHINTRWNSKIAKEFLRSHAINNGVRLIASVDKSLSTLEIKNNIKVRDARPRDIARTVQIECLAHRSSSSSMIRDVQKKHIRGFHQSLIKSKKKFLLAYLGDEILGHIAVSINSFRVGHIMTIAVDPKYQGQGISKILYFELLKHLKSKRIKVYSGVSTTEKVLGLAKKLKRRPMGIYLETSY